MNRIDRDPPLPPPRRRDPAEIRAAEEIAAAAPVAGLGQLLRVFHQSLPEAAGVAEIAQLAGRALQSLSALECFGIYLAQPPQWEFKLAHCSPPAQGEFLDGLVRKSVDAGTFAWALQQNRPVRLDVEKIPLLFHSVGTPRAACGMFVAHCPRLADSFQASAWGELSIFFGSVAYALERDSQEQRLRREIETLKAQQQQSRSELAKVGARLHWESAQRQKAADAPAPAGAAENLPRGWPVLAAGAAHDLQNMLAAVLGNLSLALRYPQETKSIQNWLEHAQKACLYARDLIQQSPPARPLLAAPPAAAPLGPASAPKKKLLILEEDLQLRQLLPAMLEKIGYDAQVARDCDEALRLFRQARENRAPYSAVILDMSEIGHAANLQTLEELKKLDAQIKVIASSSCSHDRPVARFREFGFAAALPKPYSLNQVAELLQTVIR